MGRHVGEILRCRRNLESNILWKDSRGVTAVQDKDMWIDELVIIHWWATGDRVCSRFLAIVGRDSNDYTGWNRQIDQVDVLKEKTTALYYKTIPRLKFLRLVLRASAARRTMCVNDVRILVLQVFRFHQNMRIIKISWQQIFGEWMGGFLISNRSAQSMAGKAESIRRLRSLAAAKTVAPESDK